MMKMELEKFVEFLLFLLLLLSSFYFVQDVWLNYKSNDIRFFLISCHLFSSNTYQLTMYVKKYQVMPNVIWQKMKKNLFQCEELIKKIQIN